jgi:hypothetical protein
MCCLVVAGVGFGLFAHPYSHKNTLTKLTSNSTATKISTPATSPSTTSPQASSTPTTSTSSSTAENCTKTTIPYNVTDEDDASLATGQTQVISAGTNGYTSTCPGINGHAPVTFSMSPTNEVVDIGTGQNANTSQLSTCQSLDQQENTAEQAVQSDQTNLQNIETELGAAGAGGSSEEQYLEEQAEAKLSADQTTYSNLQSEVASNSCG